MNDRRRVGISVGLSHLEHLVGPHCERLLEAARAADEAGADQIALSEHVTLTHVITDSVLITDFIRHKTIVLHAGQSYLAPRRRHH